MCALVIASSGLQGQALSKGHKRPPYRTVAGARLKHVYRPEILAVKGRHPPRQGHGADATAYINPSAVGGLDRATEKCRDQGLQDRDEVPLLPLLHFTLINTVGSSYIKVSNGCSPEITAHSLNSSKQSLVCTRHLEKVVVSEVARTKSGFGFSGLS